MHGGEGKDFLDKVKTKMYVITRNHEKLRYWNGKRWCRKECLVMTIRETFRELQRLPDDVRVVCVN